MASKLVRKKYPKKWIFLVGCYNSGTTLLQKMLGAHPQISALPREGVRFTDWLSNFETNDHHMMWDKSYKTEAIPQAGSANEAYEGIVADWSIFWDDKAVAFLEKSIANTSRIEWLNENFPNAYFLGIHRNGYCIAEGLHRRARPPEWLKKQTGEENYPLEMTARQWVIANQDMLEGIGKVERGRLIRFESFVEAPYENLQGLFEFLGLSSDCVIKTKDGVSINGENFKIKNPNPSSLARLSSNEIDKITPIISEIMAELNYPLIDKTTTGNDEKR